MAHGHPLTINASRTRIDSLNSMEMSWQDAVLRVLSESPEAMHYHDVVQAVIDKG